MVFLYAVLVLCMVAVVWAVIAAYMHMRRHMKASDTALKHVLQEIEIQSETKAGSHTGL